MADQRHPSDDLLVDAALGHLDGAERTWVTGHLDDCARCHDCVAELLAGIDLTLPAVPGAEPPAGFETRVLERMLPPDEPAAGPRGDRRVHLLAMAAAAVVGVAIGAAGVQILDRSQAPPATQVAAVAVPLTTSAGDEIGRVLRAAGDQLVIEVGDGATPDMVTCRAVLLDGSVVDLAQWELTDYGPNVWIVDEPAPGVRTVELTDQNGDLWADSDL